MKKEENSKEDIDNFFVETSEEEIQVIHSMIGNQKIWNYFLSLLDNKIFQESIEYCRENLLDKKGLPKDDFHFMKILQKMCRNFGLDEISWSQAIETYILKGELPKESLNTSCIVLDRVENGEDEYPDGYYEDNDEDKPLKEPVELYPWAYSYPVILRINPYASQREIIDYIRKGYKRYIQPIQEQYKDKDILIGKIRKKKAKIMARNKFIYEHKDLPRKKIMRLVTDNFNEILDYGHIGKIISLEKIKREKK